MAIEMIQELPHVGRLVEIRMDELGMTKAEFARRIGTTRQNVNSLLNKPSMDTAYLHRIGKALNYDFFRELAKMPGTNTIGIDRQSAEIMLASAQVQAAITKLNLLLLRDF
jgi:DNA-binding XRE family transcriptional regulator